MSMPPSELDLALYLGKRQLARPAHGRERRLPRALQRVHERLQLGASRCAVEAAHAHVDRVDLPSSDDRHDRVPGLLHLQPLFDDLAVVAGHLDGSGVAEEVGRVEHVHVQAVTLDPLAAVEQPPQVADRALVDAHAASVLHRPHGAHLVGHRADATDPGGDVGRLRECAAAQEGLEEARRLVDAQLDIADRAAVELDVHRPLALHPREVVGADHARIASVAHEPPSPRSCASLAARNAAESALKVR
jgi:hypothetical protein